MRNVTAILMRDPQTREVRAPTPAEQRKADIENVGRPMGRLSLGARGKLLEPMRIGWSIVAPSEGQARNYARWFLERGRRGSIKRRFDGSYVVTRVL